MLVLPDRRIILIISLLMMLVEFFFSSYSVNAYYVEKPDRVVYYDNKSDMMDGLLGNIRKHKTTVCVSYPGICDDFQSYKKNNYSDFFGYLEVKDGYHMGILSGYCVIVDSENNNITFQFHYITSKRQERYISRKVKKISKKFKGKNRAGKVKAAHDYLVKHMQYDDRYYSPYYAFRNGRGLCMSYALAFQRLMQEMNIPCVYVKGKNHAWNMVKLKGYWYGVDVTWDDSGGSYGYFLKGSSGFKGHKFPKSKNFKKLRMAKHSYYYR